MDEDRLKQYLSGRYQGYRSFLEEIIFPIFGKESFENNFETDLLEAQKETQSLAKQTGIKSIKNVGEVPVGVDLLHIFDITVSDRVLMERNRVNVQRVIRRVMQPYSSAFMIFHYDDDSRWEWRFSYCHKGATDKETTDNKRYTFLLGPGQSCRTATENFLKLAEKHEDIEVDDIERAFDVEALSKEFFGKYKEQYEKFVSYVTGKKYEKSGGKYVEKKVGEPHTVMYAAFKSKIPADVLDEDKTKVTDKLVRDYTKQILGRITFLHFLQKKGWLGVPAGGKWGDGDQQFMRNLFVNASEEQKADFLDVVLEPLFDKGLDTDRSADGDLFDTGVELQGGSRVRVPYLNGGLFERNSLDEIDTQFPAEFFEELLDFFYQYNFTIDENDPNEAQVGVDPEMLGRIFENLLEDNKDKGAFYTPKEIVRYMCRQSLTAYLQSDVTGEQKDAVAQFVETYDVSFLDGGDSELAKKLDQKLKDVKICDPAIGSGAFPMGLLKELFMCRGAIEHFDNAADIKRHIIQQNIYGVDIERGAVDIARLRFWLSLIVDETSPAALPNLDYKIMQGNSLLESYYGIDLSQLATKSSDMRIHEPQRNLFGEIEDRQMIISFESSEALTEFQDNVKRYYEVSSHSDRAKLREQIERFVKQSILRTLEGRIESNRLKMVSIGGSVNLSEKQQAEISKLEEENKRLEAQSHKTEESPIINSDFFLWHTWFNDVFSRPSKEGFDIVIGNPPYGAKYSDEDKKAYKNNYVTAKTIKNVQKGSLDTYTLFIELGYNLLSKDGCFAYIVPISITSSDSLTGVHRLLMNNCDDIRISSYAVRPKPVFENAVVNTSILLFRKTGTCCEKLYCTKMYRRGDRFNLQHLIDSLEFEEVRDYTFMGRMPKISLPIEKSILSKILQLNKVENYIEANGTPIYYRTTGGRYFKVVTNYPTGSTKEKAILFRKDLSNAIGCILSSSLSFWFYQIYSNNLDWKAFEIENFTIPIISDQQIIELDALYARYLADIEANANTRETVEGSSYNVDTFKEYKIVRSKHIIDEIDDYIGPLYGLNTEEIDFIKNYELEFRMAGE